MIPKIHYEHVLTVCTMSLVPVVLSYNISMKF